jgi:outer membrane protein OmpA-like peptidoglycan-associated protein
MSARQHAKHSQSAAKSVAPASVIAGSSPGRMCAVRRGAWRRGAFRCSACLQAAFGCSAWLQGPCRRSPGLPSAFALSAWLLAFAFGLPASSHAEDIDVQRFVPAATSGGYFQTESTQTRYPVDPFSLGVWLGYAHQPLIAVNGAGDIRSKIVAAQIALDITAAYAFANWFELGVHAPLSYLTGDNESAAALGDMRLLPKFTFMRDDRQGIGFGLITELRLPTHTDRFTGGARDVAFAPRLLLDHRFGLTGLRFGIDLGVLLRERTDYRNIAAASEFQAGLGLGYRFAGGRAPVELMIDLRSAVGLVRADPEEVSLEALAGVGINIASDWKLNAAAGLGLLEGFGVPTFRVLAGLRWEPSPRDPDHDGLASSQQLLDKQRQDLDPNTSAAPANPGAVENVDAVDDAERTAAIESGYDACPNLPEDYDGIEDDDGCPEGDEDGDGVLDYLDQCPQQDETINGFEDDDGCPDQGPAQIIVEDGKITILETIRFRPNSSEIEPNSYPIMNQIALALRKHHEFDAIEIGGYTDNTGPREFNMQLSRARARSVRQYLLGRGLPPRRLGARGYGPDRPVSDNATEEGRARNRRVEFVSHH